MMKTIEYHDNLYQAVKYRLEQIDPLTYENCVRSELPPFLLEAIKPKIERLFDQEKPLLVKRPDRFDFQNPELKTELARLKRLLLAHYRLQPDEVHGWIKDVIRTTADAFIVPFSTLPRMMATNGNRVSLNTLHAFFNQIPFDYPLKQSLAELTQSLETEILTLDHFQQILQEIRHQLYNENVLSVFLQELQSLKALYQWLTGGEIEVFSHTMLVRMFDDRGLDEVKRVFQKETVSAWSLQDVQNFLERYLLIGDLEQQDDTRETVLMEENVGELVLDDVSKEANGQAQPTWEGFGELSLIHNSITEAESDKDMPEGVENMAENISQENLSLDEHHHDEARLSEPETPPSVDANEPMAQESPKEPERDAAQEEKTDEFDQEIVRGYRTKRRVVITSENPVIDREKLEQQPPGPYPSLYTFMDQKIRKVFIKKLFGNDEKAFEAFVEKVDQADSWKEAKAILDTELANRNINVYSKNAIKLSDFLFSRYFSKNRY